MKLSRLFRYHANCMRFKYVPARRHILVPLPPPLLSTLDKLAINLRIYHCVTHYPHLQQVTTNPSLPQYLQFLYKRHVTSNALRLLLIFFVFSLCFGVILNENQRRRHTWTGYKWNEDARVFHSIYSKHDNSTLTTSFQFDT